MIISNTRSSAPKGQSTMVIRIDDGLESPKLSACKVCAAVVEDLRMDAHLDWHELMPEPYRNKFEASRAKRNQLGR
jgi:hypothetical protein